MGRRAFALLSTLKGASYDNLWQPMIHDMIHRLTNSMRAIPPGEAAYPCKTMHRSPSQTIPSVPDSNSTAGLGWMEPLTELNSRILPYSAAQKLTVHHEQALSSGFTSGQFTPDAFAVAPSAPSRTQGLV